LTPAQIRDQLAFHGPLPPEPVRLD
jgi:hypothetical protein